MFNRRIKIPANSETAIRGNTKRVVVRNSSFEFDLHTDKDEVVTLGRGDNFEFENTASFIRLINNQSIDNELELVISTSDEGNLSATSTTTEIKNVSELRVGASDFEVHNIVVSDSGTQLLSSDVSNRLYAVIQTQGEVIISKSIGGPGFSVDGVLTHEARGDLFAIAPVGTTVQVQIIEYLL